MAAEFVHDSGMDNVVAMIRYKDAVQSTYYYHKDALGSVTEITDVNGAVVKSYEYKTFGTIIRSSGSLLESPYTYTGREYDEETGLYYYRARYYNPMLGRFINKDPIGISGGLNMFIYVGNNPVNAIDPTGNRASIDPGSYGVYTTEYFAIYDGTSFSIYHQGVFKVKYEASSGKSGYSSPENQHIRNKGPIPEGRYWFVSSDIMGGFLREFVWNDWRGRDWGKWRVRLFPYPETKTYGRSGFFIHGGRNPGSAGCIDIGNNDESFNDIFEDHKEKVDVIVDY